MKKSISQIQYNRLIELYCKLNLRLNKHFSLGRFNQFTKQQQFKLLNRLERIKNQLTLLERGAKITRATLLVGASLFAIDANAQFSASGAEYKVNTHIQGIQKYSAVAKNSSGDYVITWTSGQGQDGDKAGIFAQRYNASRVAQGSEFKVNTHTNNDQSNSVVAIDSDGDFVIAWQSRNQDGSNYGIYAQRYNAAGAAQGSEFLVNTYTNDNQIAPAIAMDNDGDFVITWSSAQDGNAMNNDAYGIYAQRYNQDGSALGTEFPVNTFIGGPQFLTSIAMDSDGDFVVSWQSNDQTQLGSQGIFAQRYNASGNALGSEFQVNDDITNIAGIPSVSMDCNGDFVVAWIKSTGSNQDVFAKRFDACGAALGAEFQVNSYSTFTQSNPSVAMDNGGDFVIAYQSTHMGVDGYNIYAQRYDASGVALGIEFQVNTYTDSYQRNPSVALDDNGNFVVVWPSYKEDGSDYGVYAQNYIGAFEIKANDVCSTPEDSTSATCAGGRNSDEEDQDEDNQDADNSNEQGNHSFGLYPNPSKGQIQIEIDGEGSVRITDLSGHLIKEELCNGSNSLNIEGLKTGTYIVQVEQNGAQSRKRLVVE